MSVPLIIVIAVAAALVAFVWLTYNRMVGRRQAVDNSWAQIETALERRHNLIPNLVEAVKGYATHEQSTFVDVTKARAAAENMQAPPRQAATERTLGGAVGRVMLLAENYPQLKASDNFSQLQSSLSEAEDQIQITRRVYNDTVQTYNTLIQVFPAVIVARAFGFRRRDFFDAPAEAEVAPEVKLSGVSGAA